MRICLTDTPEREEIEREFAFFAEREGENEKLSPFFMNLPYFSWGESQTQNRFLISSAKIKIYKTGFGVSFVALKYTQIEEGIV